MNRDEIIEQLLTDRPAALFGEADRVRRLHMGDAIHLRGLIEFSNACGRDCLYCGIRRSNKDVVRYRMGIEEIFETAKGAQALGLDSHWGTYPFVSSGNSAAAGAGARRR